MESRARRTPPLLLWRSIQIVAMTAVVALVSGCGSTSRVSSWTEFDSSSETAIVLLGTSVAGHDDTTNERRAVEPLVFSTFWQPYDPASLRLGEGDTLELSRRVDTIFEGDEFLRWEMSAVEIPPGHYALTVTRIHRTMTSFIPLTGSNSDIEKSLGGLSVKIGGFADPAKNFLFEVRPGQVVYLGHFEFISAPLNSDLVGGVNYAHNEAAARAALTDFPGVTSEMITLYLALGTETAAK